MDYVGECTALDKQLVPNIDDIGTYQSSIHSANIYILDSDNCTILYKNKP
jgi:hypothetical protein